MKKTLALTVALAGLAALAWAGLPLRAQEEGRARIENLAWMEGHWHGRALGGAVEEIWSAPSAGGMMGMFRLVDESGKISLYEFLLIEQGQRGLELRFKHFGPGYVPWEKETPLTFELESWTDRRAQFVSTDPDQSPTHMLYSHLDDDQMLVTVQTVREGREPESFDVMFKRGE
jgi:hypothetical protein